MLQEVVLPDRINRLNELAANLWWSWSPRARDLMRTLDIELWRLTTHNPVSQLRRMEAGRLQAAAADPSFLALYDSVMAEFDSYMASRETWFSRAHPQLNGGPVAYLCMEFAIHSALPFYAGGLGILAGDLLKSGSDLGVPMVGVGFMYPQGYFHQHILADGWQQEVYRQVDFADTPILPVLASDGSRLAVQVDLAGRTVHIGIWRVRLGRVDLYLLDTNVPQNNQHDAELSARLYVADQELRMEQEIVLGIGGVRALRALGINPVVWHANEAHTAFMTVERAREFVAAGMPFSEALRRVCAATLFTTHTPVPAGHDFFPIGLVERYFHGFWPQLGIQREEFLSLGQYYGPGDPNYSMTVLAMKTADGRNAVSKLHGQVSRKMWHRLWPDVPEDKVPITHITNGVHMPTWVAPELRQLLCEKLGNDLISDAEDRAAWDRVGDLPDNELWEVHRTLKRKLMSVMRQQAQQRWADGEVTAQQVVAMGALLDPDTLTVGFVRRFAQYKRPDLVFRDIDRLRKILTDRWRPVQLVFAGKSHPADLPAKGLLQHVYRLATDCGFHGRIAFVEDYDMHVSRYLVHGVDVWLNNPRRLQEACGTSGIKACLNGVPHLSVQDGWWDEAFNGSNGWAIGDDAESPDALTEDRVDAESIYRLLEEEIAPLYYQRGRDGIPRGWVKMMKEAMRLVVPSFSAGSTLREYTERFYAPMALSVTARAGAK